MKHIFDYSEIKGKIPADIVSLVKSISSFETENKNRKRAYSKEYEAVANIAKIASVKYSNEIEGIVTTDERIEELILRGGRPLDHDEEEISGYGIALDMIHNGFGRTGIDENVIKTLHRVINAGKDDDRGTYKTRNNIIAEIDSFGRKRIVFEPVPADETEDCMNQMFIALMEADSDGCEPLLLIPCVILDYLCIHPFIDGNGRTSRLLTIILLYMFGIDICRYVSMDEHIAATKSRYYSALSQSSEGWMENKHTYFPFIRYFLQMLYECYIDLDTRFLLVDGKKLTKKRRIETVLSKSVTPMSKRQIQMMLPDVSLPTVESAIKELLKSSKIEKMGSFKDARYRMKRQL